MFPNNSNNVLVLDADNDYLQCKHYHASDDIMLCMEKAKEESQRHHLQWEVVADNV